MPKRLFIALPIPKETRALFVHYGKQLRLPDVRWISESNIHITLHFFGNVDEKIIPELGATCKEICARHQPFTLTFKNITLAPPQDPRRMIWAEYDTNQAYQSLTTELKQGIKTFLQSHNQIVMNGDKALIPHATLARCGPAFQPKHSPLPQLKVPDLFVETVQFIASQLGPEGSMYTVLDTMLFDHN
jgi:RNA 2',3'-cyclic 3'-phosphodiesterase